MVAFDAADRVERYLDRLDRQAGLDKEVIHGLDGGDDAGGVSLLASDLRELVRISRVADLRELEELGYDVGQPPPRVPYEQVTALVREDLDGDRTVRQLASAALSASHAGSDQFWVSAREQETLRTLPPGAWERAARAAVAERGDG